MEDTIYIGKNYSTVTKAVYKNGRWVVDQYVTESRSTDLDSWSTKEVSASATADELSKAMAEASITIIKYLQAVGGSLFLEDEIGSEEIKQ